MIFLNRDSIGRFVPKRIAFLKVLGITVAVFAVLAGISEGAVKLNKWSMAYGLQKPYVILTNQDDVVIQLIKRPVVYKRNPMQLLSPVVAELERPAQSLNSTEQKIVDKFGPKYGYIALAVFRCESGLDPEALSHTRDVGIGQINWPVWKNPVKEKFGYTLKDMFEVDKNLEVAYWIFDRDGDGEGSFDPWVVFQTGAFRGCIR